MKTTLIILLAILMASCQKQGDQYLEHNATIKAGKQGDGTQIGYLLTGKGIWKGDIVRLRITFMPSAWFPVASNYYGESTPIFKVGGIGEGGFFFNHRSSGAVVGWNPSKKKGYFWVGTYSHSGKNVPPSFHYAMEVKENQEFDVLIRKSSTDGKYYYTFIDPNGATINKEEPCGKEFICYKLYFFLGGEGDSYVSAPWNLNAKLKFMEL